MNPFKHKMEKTDENVEKTEQSEKISKLQGIKEKLKDFFEHGNKDKIEKKEQSEKKITNKDKNESETDEKKEMKPRNQILETPNKPEKKWYDEFSAGDKIAAGEKGKNALKHDLVDAKGWNDSFENCYYYEKNGKKRKEELSEIRSGNNHMMERLKIRTKSLEAGIAGAQEKMDENFAPNNSEYQKYSKIRDEFKGEYAKALYMIGKLEENNKSIDREIGSSESSDGNEKGNKMSVKERMQDFFERHKK